MPLEKRESFSKDLDKIIADNHLNKEEAMILENWFWKGKKHIKFSSKTQRDILRKIIGSTELGSTLSIAEKMIISQQARKIKEAKTAEKGMKEMRKPTSIHEESAVFDSNNYNPKRKKTQNQTPEKTPETGGLNQFMNWLESQIGIREGKEANRYLNGGNSKKTPWCAAFINAGLRMVGLPTSGSNRAKSFIGENNGIGHVGVIAEGGTVITGNYGNAVKRVPITYFSPRIAGWRDPVTGEIHKGGSINTIKNKPGTIVVWNRGKERGLA